MLVDKSASKLDGYRRLKAGLEEKLKKIYHEIDEVKQEIRANKFSDQNKEGLLM